MCAEDGHLFEGEGDGQGEWITVHGATKEGNRRYEDNLRGWRDAEGRRHIQSADELSGERMMRASSCGSRTTMRW